MIIIFLFIIKKRKILIISQYNTKYNNFIGNFKKSDSIKNLEEYQDEKLKLYEDLFFNTVENNSMNIFRYENFIIDNKKNNKILILESPPLKIKIRATINTSIPKIKPNITFH